MPGVPSTILGHAPRSAALPNLQRDVLPFPLAGGRCQSPQCGRGAALTPDHLPEIVRGHEELDQRFVPVLRFGHAHRVGPIGQYLREQLDDRTDTGVGHALAPDLATDGAAAGGAGVRCRRISVRTESESCAPFPSQYSTRSLSTRTRAGFERGL